MSDNKPVNLQDIVALLSNKPSDQWFEAIRLYDLSDEQRSEVLQTLSASSATGVLRSSPTVLAGSGEGSAAASPEKVDRIQSLNRFFERESLSGAKYRVLEMIGRGGMGDVYKAQQHFPVKRLVAMKLIKPGFDSNDVIARFESERQALARMDHTSIAKVLDAGVDDRGRPFFVMEYVPGISIIAFADNNRLSVQQRLELFIQVCSAIAHAHSKAIIHRDIKSSNTLAYFSDGTPVVKVIDFGIAKALGGDRLSDLTIYTELGRAIGSYESMSPEQADASPDIDTRTDVYSLGVLLYELLAGAKPFDRNTFARAADHEIRRIIREVEPARPSVRLSSLGDSGTKIATSRRAHLDALTKQLRSELEWIPLKAMRKERDRRYASPLELSEDIRNYLEHRPLRAGPESVRYRVRKYYERHRAAIFATATIIILLVAGVAVSTRFAVLAKRAEGDAKGQAGRALAAEADATKQKDRAVAAEHNVTEQLKQVKQNLARSLIAEGDSSGQAQPAEARQLYMEALEVLESLGSSQTAVKAKLVERTGDETPLMGSYGTNRGAGGFVRHSGSVDAVAVSHHGFTAVTASRDNSLTLWDLKTGAAIHKFAGTAGHTDEVTFVDFAPDDRTFLSASNDGTVKQWDAGTGNLVQTLRTLNRQVWVVACSPDGQTALSGGLTDEGPSDMELWDLPSGKRIRVFRGHAAQVAGINFSPDGRWAISGCHDGTIKLWDVQSGKDEPDRKFEGHTGPVNCVDFSPTDGKLAVSASFDGSLRLWDVATGTPHGKPMMGQWNGQKRYRFWRVRFSPDGRFLASVSEDSTVQLWNVQTQEAIGPPFTAGSGEVMGVGFLPDSTGVVSSRGPRPGQDWSPGQSALALWRLDPDRDSRDIEHRQYPLTSVAVSDGNLVLFGTAGGTLELWDAATRHTLGTVTPPGKLGAIRALSLTRDGRRALSGSRDGKMSLWDLETGKVVKELTGHIGAVNAVAFLPPNDSNASRAISCGDDGKLLLWDLSPAGSSGVRELHKSDTPITSLSVTPNGEQAILAAEDYSGHVCLLDLKSLVSGKSPRSNDDDRVYESDQKQRFPSDSVTWSDDGQSILYTSPGFMPGTLRLAHVGPGGSYMTVTGKAYLVGHTSRVTAKAFSPDGAMALSGDEAGTVILWDIAGRKPFKRFENAHLHSVTGIAVSPDGSCAVSVSEDKTVRLWDFSRAIRQRDLETRVRAARDALVKEPDDSNALAAFGEWYALRGKNDWAVEFLERARAGGAAVSGLTLGRCYWLLDKMPEAHREFLKARQSKEASAFYTSLYLKATETTAAR